MSCNHPRSAVCSECFEPCAYCDSFGHTTREHKEWKRLMKKDVGRDLQ